MIPYLGESLEKTGGEGFKNNEPLSKDPRPASANEKQDGAIQAESDTHSEAPWRRQSMRHKILWFLFLVSLVAVSNVYAKKANYRFGGGSGAPLKVPEGQVIEGNHYMAFGSVIMAGTVSGDLCAAGGNVSIPGKVGRDLWVAGGEITVGDSVGEDVRAAGGQVSLSGPIGGDLMCFAGNTDVDSGCKVAGKVMISTGDLTWAGEAGKDLEAYAGVITLKGVVHGNANLSGTDIVVGPGAVVEGDLVYTSTAEAKISPQAVVKGKTDHRLPPERAHKPKKHFPLAAILKILTFWAWGLGSLLLGSLLMNLFPGMGQRIEDRIRTLHWAALAGFIVLSLAPAVILALLLSVLGVPIGLALLGAVLFALIASIAFAGLTLGRALVELITKKPAAAWFWPMALGVFVIQLLGLIPCFGLILKLLVAIVGVGGMYLALVGAMKHKTA
jgi:cytoskeletal protein CcmA (bactofilin family)